MRLSLPPLSFRSFAAAACVLPLLGWCLHHALGHQGDLHFFHQWARAFMQGPAFYRDGPGVNYPILGALLVCAPSSGVASVLGARLDFEMFRLVHKAVLVLGETALILASSRLLKVTGSPRPHWLALGLFLLPSSWAGGAWFGQTDIYGTLALVVAAVGLLRYHASGAPFDLLRGVLSLHAAFLLKQLTWFAIPPLFVLLLTGLLLHRNGRHGLATAASVALWFVADPWLNLPDGHVSHLVYVVTRSAGDHGSLLVANGASLWILLRASGLQAGDAWLGPLTPAAVGWVTWAGATAAWSGGALRRAEPRGLVTAAGVSSLVMAVVLTGVHERYLAHAVPVLFLMTRGRDRWAVVVLGVVAGGFVLSSVHPELTWAGRPEAVLLASLFCLGLLAMSEWEKMNPGRPRS